MKKLISLILAMVLLLSLAACGAKEQAPADDVKETAGDVQQPAAETQQPEESYEVRLGVLKGPTGIGASWLLEQNDQEKTLNKYTVSIAAEATDMISQIASGQLDMAAIPTNAAAALYNKTNGAIKVAALNTAGVLYILEKGDSIKTVADLKGKTIYAPGQGANPEYVLKYILSKNGVDPEKDCTIEFGDSAEIQTKMAAGEIDLCMLPVPAATAVLVKNAEVRSAIDMTAEWDALNTGSMLTMGCVVVRSEFAEANPKTVENFLKEYEESINAVKNDPKAAGEYCAKFEIIPAAAIATKAIPDAGLIFVSGSDIKDALEGYLQVLFDANPKSVGGKMPGDEFYGVN